VSEEERVSVHLAIQQYTKDHSGHSLSIADYTTNKEQCQGNSQLLIGILTSPFTHIDSNFLKASS